MKHYRLDCPVIPDNMDSLRHIIRVRGISNVAIFGGDGKCVYNVSMAREVDEYAKVIDQELKKIRGPNRKKGAYVECGAVYPPDIRKEGRIVHEWMPALAADPEGGMHLAYVSDESGTNDVFLMSSDAKGKWGKPVEIAATDADEYAPAVTVAKGGQVVVAYTANPKGGNYDIHTVVVKKGKPGKPKRVTRSEDDAMAPSLCFDGGSVWLAWYEWRKMGALSRDREIFVAKGTGSQWTKPEQVSPVGVGSSEDHADPVVRPDGKGGAWVAWAWDYHPHQLASRPPVEENSIFVRHVDGRMKMGDPLAAGFRGEGRARDYHPTLAVTADGVPWTAWDNQHKASTDYGHKAIYVNRLDGEDFGEQFEATPSAGPLCTPSLAAGPEGKLALVWAQWTSKWELRRSDPGPDGPGEVEKLKVKGKVPRYPAIAFDAEGQLWVAYADTDGKKWKVLVEKVR